MKQTLLRLSIPLRVPFITAYGRHETRELLLLRLEQDGVTGYGEAGPLEGYDRESIEECARALLSPPDAGWPAQARLCLELAQADLQGRLAGTPAIAAGGEPVEVNHTLRAGPVAEVAADAAAAAAAGYTTFKLKVGLDDDLDRVSEVRAAIGPSAKLRLDANGAWDAAQAVRAIRRLTGFDLEFVEQPCRTLGEMAEVRDSVEVPLAADESIATAEDVRAAAAEGACDLVCVKLARSGGVEEARKSLRAAEAAGMDAVLASTLDGPWTIAAALRLAGTERVTAACGLATLGMFDGAIGECLPPPVAGRMTIPAGPGLGVDLPEEALAQVLVEELE
ncbi:MAG: L-Ala-D/L-Glu epimerase [Thermoleophilaceae bacterium]|nr:L-Ala-D/L-Glu epimerase [Thermoleophilaceae bacterium]